MENSIISYLKAPLTSHVKGHIVSQSRRGNWGGFVGLKGGAPPDTTVSSFELFLLFLQINLSTQKTCEERWDQVGHALNTLNRYLQKHLELEMKTFYENHLR